MKIADGGQTEKLTGKVETIIINRASGRTFELWINNDSLSYVSLDKLLDLKDEIYKALNQMLI